MDLKNNISPVVNIILALAIISLTIVIIIYGNKLFTIYNDNIDIIADGSKVVKTASDLTADNTIDTLITSIGTLSAQIEDIMPDSDTRTQIKETIEAVIPKIQPRVDKIGKVIDFLALCDDKSNEIDYIIDQVDEIIPVVKPMITTLSPQTDKVAKIIETLGTGNQLTELIDTLTTVSGKIDKIISVIPGT
tara:strand:- start:244 stop:816 length:573 start_codon:yes stop_codon:yes gene_type:complete